jgi:hypothetical protein
MTRNSVARYELQVVLACLDHATHPFGPAPPNSRSGQRETKIIGRAPAISKLGTATTGKPGAFHLFGVVASNAHPD